MHEHRKYAVDLEEKLHRQMEQVLTEKKHRLAILTGQMEGVSPLKKLSQGFSYVADETGKNGLTDVSRFKSGGSTYGTSLKRNTEGKCHGGI